MGVGSPRAGPPACERCQQPEEIAGLCHACARFVLTFELDASSGDYHRIIRPRTRFRCGLCGAVVKPLGVLCARCFQILTDRQRPATTTGDAQ